MTVLPKVHQCTTLLTQILLTMLTTTVDKHLDNMLLCFLPALKLKQSAVGLEGQGRSTGKAL